jgi:N-methylhydantoinase A
MHACAIAEDLGVPRVLVPRHPGVTAALGLLLSDVRHDLRRSWIRATADVQPGDLDAAVRELESDGRARLAASGRVDGSSAVVFELDMRYRGQAYNLTVPLGARPVTGATLAAAEAAFHDAHRRAYDYTPGDTATEIVTLRARATGAVSRSAWNVSASSAAVASGAARDVWSRGEHRPYTVLERDALRPGARVEERTIVEQEDCTLVVPPGWAGEAGTADMLVLHREDA